MAAASRILGVILAGGEGRRVGGEDKGLLPLHDRPVVEHVVSILRPQCDELLIVANRNRDRYARYATVTGDEVPNHAGPLAGIVAALTLIESERKQFEGSGWLMTVPVDCPGLPPDLFARLRTAFQAAPEVLCTYARHAHKREPLFALYSLEFRDKLLASARKALGVHASPLRWHMELDAVAVDFSDQADAFLNLNTPEDFRDYECMHP